MNRSKRYIAWGIVLGAILLLSNVQIIQAARTEVESWVRDSNGFITPRSNGDNLGDTSSRIPNGYFTNLSVSGTCTGCGSGGGSISGGTAGMITSWTSGSTVTATGTPYAASYVATSTIATSTFAGGITGPNSLTIQQSSGRVGIGITNPTTPLYVNGAITGTSITSTSGSYDQPNFFNPVAGDTNWSFGISHTASEYWMQAGYFDAGDSLRGFRVKDMSSGNTAFSSNVSQTIIPTGNVGVGSTTPGSVLSVGGVANFRAATSTFYSTGGINLTGGCFSINGACVSGSGSVGGSTKSFYATVCASGCTYTTNGTGDDVPINQALVAANAAGGGTVKILNGTYNLAARLDLTNMRNITIMGDGPGTTLKPTGADTQTIKASSTVNALIRDLAIDGTNQTGSAFNSDFSIAIKNSHNVIVTNVQTRNNKGYSVFVFSDAVTPNFSTTSEIVIANNNFQCNALQDCIGGGPDETSFGLSTTTGVVITGNTIVQKTFAGGVLNSSMDANCIDLVAVQQINFSNNFCKGQIVWGSEQNPNQYSKISDNIIEPPEGPQTIGADIVVITNGTTYSLLPGNLDISGNTIKYGHILVTGAGSNIVKNVLIANNTITTATSSAANYNGIQSHGINVDTIADSLITGNIINGFSSISTSTGIKVISGTNVIVSNNTVKEMLNGIDLGSGTGNRAMLNTFLSVTNPTLNGSSLLSFDSLGYLGIGTSTSYSTATVWGKGTGSGQLFSLVNNASTTVFQVLDNGNIGIGSTSPFTALALGIGNGSSTKAILVAEHRPATSTSMTIDWTQGNQQNVRVGTAGVTVAFSGYTDGQTLKLLICNPNASAGTLTFSTQVLWSGGTAPTRTTTANKCDIYSFIATQATSTLKIFGAQNANF